MSEIAACEKTLKVSSGKRRQVNIEQEEAIPGFKSLSGPFYWNRQCHIDLEDNGVG